MEVVSGHSESHIIHFLSLIWSGILLQQYESPFNLIEKTLTMLCVLHPCDFFFFF